MVGNDNLSVDVLRARIGDELNLSNLLSEINRIDGVSARMRIDSHEVFEVHVRLDQPQETDGLVASLVFIGFANLRLEAVGRTVQPLNGSSSRIYWFAQRMQYC